MAMKRKDWHQAAKRWKELFDTLQDNVPKKAYLKMCEAYRRQGLYSEAEDVIIQGMQKYPKAINCYIKHAEIAMDQKNWSEAVNRWKKLLDKFKENIPSSVYVKHSLVYRNQNRFKEAEEIINDGLKQYPEDMALHEEFANILFMQKDWRAAADKYEFVCNKQGTRASSRTYKNFEAAHKKSGCKENFSIFYGDIYSREDKIAYRCYSELIKGEVQNSIQLFSTLVNKVFINEQTRDLWIGSFQMISQLFSSDQLPYKQLFQIEDYKKNKPNKTCKKIFVGGMNRSGSSALFDFFREFKEVCSIREELPHIEGIPGLISLRKLINNQRGQLLLNNLEVPEKDLPSRVYFLLRILKKLFNKKMISLLNPLTAKRCLVREELLKFFALNLLGYGKCHSYAEYRNSRLGRSLSLSQNNKIYAQGVNLFCKAMLEIIIKDKYESDDFNNATNILLDTIAATKGAKKESVILFNNVVHVHKISAIEFIDNTFLFCAFRDPRANYVARIQESAGFTQNVHEYIVDYRKKRKKYFSVFNRLNHNKSCVYPVQFEYFVLSEDYRNRLAKKAGLDLSNQNKYKYLYPSEVSKKNVFLHETYENQDEIRAIEEALPEYCVDMHKLKREF